MATATVRLSYSEIQTSIAEWLMAVKEYQTVSPDSVSITVDRGGGTPVDSGYTYGKATVDSGMVRDLDMDEIREAVILWLKNAKNLKVLDKYSIHICQDNGGGTANDRGSSTYGEARVETK